MVVGSVLYSTAAEFCSANKQKQHTRVEYITTLWNQTFELRNQFQRNFLVSQMSEKQHTPMCSYNFCCSRILQLKWASNYGTAHACTVANIIPVAEYRDPRMITIEGE